MSAASRWWPRLVALPVLLTGLLVSSGLAGPSSEAAEATPHREAAVQRVAPRAAASPAVVGDINNDGVVDIRDYGVWRTSFGQTNCGNAADLDANCIVDTRDYGVWRANFGQTGSGTNCIPAGAICHANVSTFAGSTTGPIVLADCANPADPVNCARFVSAATGFTVTGRFGTVSGNFGVNLTIAVVDATTGVSAGTRTVNCPGSNTTCSNVLVSGNVRPQLGGSVALSTMPVGAPDSTGLYDFAVAAPDRDPT